MSSQKRILIIDDVAENIQVAMNILKEDNYIFSFATQGNEALEIIKKEATQLDLILLDIMMPGLDGFDVCRMIKSNPKTKDIPVIFLTAKVDVDSISQGFALGAIDYITKPFHAEELQARVKTHLELYHARLLLQENNIALETKLKFESKRLLTELEQNQKDMIFMLTELMEFTSDETGKHIRRVAEICSLLASYHPSLSDEDADTLYHSSPMHDIGKLTIPQEILNKPGKFTEDEFNIMKAHTTNAYNMMRNSKRRLTKAAAIIAHEHHEKWDGTGYPRKLKGNAIHIYGRIVALADVFDALAHKRCYKEAWEIQTIVDYIMENRAIQFDPQLVDIMMGHIEEFIEIVKIE